MKPLKREYKFFLGGFLTGGFVYIALFILSFYLRIRALRG